MQSLEYQLSVCECGRLETKLEDFDSFINNNDVSDEVLASTPM